jgi:D-alanyl-D-alanine endopeptidase (penicillin-binding protein 7)
MWTNYKVFIVSLISCIALTVQAVEVIPHLTAKSWLVADAEGKIIDGSNTKEVRSIASITKLMTVMIVLDAKQNLEQRVNQYTREQLIDLALIRSNNQAAEALCEAYPTGKHGCIRAMNAKSKELGLTHTTFVEPTGLSIWNVSTAEDLVLLVKAASTYPEIVTASQISEVKIKLRKKWLVFQNTNPIIGKKHKFIVSKTGYINASGGCIVMMLDTDIGHRTVVVLGSKNTKTRIPEAEFIFENIK